MSKESAIAFIEKARTDNAFAGILALAETREKRMIIAQDAGFVFSSEELQEAKSEIPISDEELAFIAGGCSCPGLEEPLYLNTF